MAAEAPEAPVLMSLYSKGLGPRAMCNVAHVHVTFGGTWVSAGGKTLPGCPGSQAGSLGVDCGWGVLPAPFRSPTSSHSTAMGSWT